jgi:hypothetical protein
MSFCILILAARYFPACHFMYERSIINPPGGVVIQKIGPFLTRHRRFDSTRTAWAVSKPSQYLFGDSAARNHGPAGVGAQHHVHGNLRIHGLRLVWHHITARMSWWQRVSILSWRMPRGSGAAAMEGTCKGQPSSIGTHGAKTCHLFVSGQLTLFYKTHQPQTHQARLTLTSICQATPIPPSAIRAVSL